MGEIKNKSRTGTSKRASGQTGKPVRKSTNSTGGGSGRPRSAQNKRPNTKPGQKRMKKARPKQKVKKQLNYTNAFIMMVFFIAVSMYLGQTVYSLMTKPEIPSMTVQMGSVDFPVVTEGVIIRDERTYTSPATGVVNYYYNDLERIKKDDVVCFIMNESEYNLQNELSKINADFLSLQERRGSMSAFDSDVAAFNENIKEYIDNNVYATINEGIAGTYDLKDSISQNIAIRNQMMLSENRGSVQNLYDQKQIYENELNKNISNIRVTGSGILSYSYDGLEDDFNFGTRKDLTEGQIKTQGTGVRNSNENLVKADDAVFKIVESNEWYIAAYLSIEQIYDWTENMTKTIYIQKSGEYTPYEMVVEKINKLNNDAYILLRSSKNLLDFINVRNVKFKVNDSEYKGYKVPNTAIIDKTFLKIPVGYLIESDTNLTYVIKRTFDRDIQIPVTIYSKNEEYCLVSQNFNTVSLGDRIVKQNKETEEYVISDVENCKGVYIINNGYAEFRRVSLNPDIPEKNPYTILDPNENKSIKIFDRIISDTRNIIEGQKIF